MKKNAYEVKIKKEHTQSMDSSETITPIDPIISETSADESPDKPHVVVTSTNNSVGDKDGR